MDYGGPRAVKLYQHELVVNWYQRPPPRSDRYGCSISGRAAHVLSSHRSGTEYKTEEIARLAGELLLTIGARVDQTNPDVNVAFQAAAVLENAAARDQLRVLFD